MKRLLITRYRHELITEEAEVEVDDDEAKRLIEHYSTDILPDDEDSDLFCDLAFSYVTREGSDLSEPTYRVDEW